MARVPGLFSPGSFIAAGDPFLTLHREMNRLFDDVARGSPSASGQGGSDNKTVVDRKAIALGEAKAGLVDFEGEWPDLQKRLQLIEKGPCFRPRSFAFQSQNVGAFV